jgi:hypothetical protein
MIPVFTLVFSCGLSLEINTFMVVNGLSFVVVFRAEQPAPGCDRLGGLVSLKTLKKLLLPLG